MLAVRLENRPQSSRWYPGRDCIAMSAGWLRNVFMFRLGVHSSPHRMFLLEYASVRLRTTIRNAGWMFVFTDIIARDLQDSSP